MTENNGIVTVVGGDTVTVNTSSTKGVTIGNSKGTASPAGAVTINDTASKGAINVYGGTNVTITSSGNGTINVGDSATVAPSVGYNCCCGSAVYGYSMISSCQIIIYGN